MVLAAGVLDGEVASMSNILEQEDIVKGLPDAALDSEMQQPSGQIPQFLILSEIHRRTEMRNNFAANEDDLSTPIVSQMLAASSASRQGLGNFRRRCSSRARRDGSSIGEYRWRGRNG